MRGERVGESVGRESRRLDGFLEVHTKYLDIEQGLQHRLGLHVAAGAAERHDAIGIDR